MKRFHRSLLLAFIVAVTAASLPAEQPSRDLPPPLVLVSLDAFRWDYCDLYPDDTPHLRDLIRRGVSARSLIPVFPSNTFPNHYTLVTGLYPSRHGMINNTFFDPERREVFAYTRSASVQDKRWWGGEPIWVTARRQGRASASSFWVGSEAEIGGFRPTFWRSWNPAYPFEQRLDEVVHWLRRPPVERPAVVTFYLEETNSIGHKFGVGSPELRAAIKLQDERVGLLLQRLATENVTINLVIVSDHGLTDISPERVIFLDEFIAADDVQLDFDGPVAGLRPRSGNVDELMQALAPLKNGKAFRVEELPARFRVSANPRNPPVWIVPDEGWEIYFRARFDLFRGRFNRGDHGYDPALPSMHGILIAHGPAFRADGAVVASAESVHVYNLLCAATGLAPAPNDGDERLARAMLRR